MKTKNLLKTGIALALGLFVSVGAWAAPADLEVTFSGVYNGTGWAAHDGVIPDITGSNSSKTVDCVAGKVNYPGSTGASAYVALKLDDTDETLDGAKIDSINVVWTNGTSGQYLPVIYGESYGAVASNTIPVTNGGFNRSSLYLSGSSNSTNCNNGTMIRFPEGSNVRFVLLSRQIVPAANVSENTNSNFNIKLNGSAATGYPTAYGSGSSVYVARIILYINYVGPSLKATPTSLAFGEIAANANSVKTTKIEGANLTGDLTVVYPAGYTGATTITPAQAQASGGYTLSVTFNEDEDLTVGDYNNNITISGGGLAASLSIPVTGSIKAADTTAPTVASVSPLETAKLPLAGDIVVTFNESIALGTGDITLNGTAIVPTISADGLTATFAYSGLTHSSSASLIFLAGSIVDLASNSYAGGTLTWTTETPDPTIMLTSAAASQSQVLKAGYTIGTITFSVANATSVSVSGLPTGVSETIDNLGNGSFTVTINGTLPTATTTYPEAHPYTVDAVKLSGATGNDAQIGGTLTIKDPNANSILYITMSDQTAQNADDFLQALKSVYDVTVRGSVGMNAIPVPYSEYDLVVLHESLNGGDAAVTGNELRNIKNVDIPILNLKSYFYTTAGTARWGWGTPSNGSTTNKIKVLDPTHPIFAKLTLDTADEIQIIGSTRDKNIQPSTIDGIGGTILGIPSGAANTQAAIHELTPAERGVANSKYLMISVLNTAFPDLTADGVKLLTNAVAYLLAKEETPIVDFTLKWSPATINNTAKTIDVTINSKTDNFGSQISIETYFTAPGYTLQIGGTPVTDGDYVDYSSWLPAGGIPADGTAFDYDPITVTLTSITRAAPIVYTLNIHDQNNTVSATGLGETPAEIVSTEYYTLTGIKLAKPAAGVLIKKTLDTNGKTEVSKVIVK